MYMEEVVVEEEGVVEEVEGGGEDEEVHLGEVEVTARVVQGVRGDGFHYLEAEPGLARRRNIEKLLLVGWVRKLGDGEEEIVNMEYLEQMVT